jgi:hypothetical protein
MNQPLHIDVGNGFPSSSINEIGELVTHPQEPTQPTQPSLSVSNPNIIIESHALSINPSVSNSVKNVGSNPLPVSPPIPMLPLTLRVIPRTSTPTPAPTLSPTCKSKDDLFWEIYDKVKKGKHGGVLRTSFGRLMRYHISPPTNPAHPDLSTAKFVQNTEARCLYKRTLYYYSCQGDTH